MHALILPGLDGTGKLLADFVEALKPGIHDIAPRARLAAIAGPHFLLQANPVEAAAAIHSFADSAGRKLACMSHLP